MQEAKRLPALMPKYYHRFSILISLPFYFVLKNYEVLGEVGIKASAEGNSHSDVIVFT
jgi:hypothetical protein